MALTESTKVANDLTLTLAGARRDVESVLQVGVATLSRVRPGTWVAIIMDSDVSTSRVVVADDADPAMAHHIDRYISALMRPGHAPTTGLSQRVIDSGQAILLPRVPYERFGDHMSREGQEWWAREAPPSPIRAVGTVMVPMQADGQTIGTLALLQWNPDVEMSDADVAWVQTVADRLALAVENAQSLNISSLRLGRLSSLQRAALTLTSSPVLRLTLTVTAEQVAAALPADAVDVLVLDEPAGEFFVAATSGFRRTSMPEYRFAARGQDQAEFGRAERRSMFAREGFRSYVPVRLVVRGRLVGVMEVFHRSEPEIDPESLVFLDAMATHAAIAIDNAQLKSDLERLTQAHGPAPQAAADISPTDRKIVAMICDGATNADIAEHVHMSVHTVKFHVRRLRERLGASNRTDLALKATKLGWI